VTNIWSHFDNGTSGCNESFTIYSHFQFTHQNDVDCFLCMFMRGNRSSWFHLVEGDTQVIGMNKPGVEQIAVPFKLRKIFDEGEMILH